MILSDTDIKKSLDSGHIKITPLPDLAQALGTVSVDLRLGPDFMVYRRTAKPFIDVHDNKDNFMELTETILKKDGEPFVVHPGEFVLGATMESLELPPDLAGRLEGKSSLGRLGIVIHSTAGKVDPGFTGHLVLEITNIGNLPIMLYPGMRICQLLFEQVSSAVSKSYIERDQSKYKHQTGTTGSRISAEN
jgi:dCTP deaminase